MQENLDRLHANWRVGDYDWHGVLHVIWPDNRDEYEYMFVSSSKYDNSRVMSAFGFKSLDECLDDARARGINLKD